jgi:hypothetical protein
MNNIKIVRFGILTIQKERNTVLCGTTTYIVAEIYHSLSGVSWPHFYVLEKKKTARVTGQIRNKTEYAHIAVFWILTPRVIAG